ncbi:hypothetical protein C5167_010905 [Papaver somniferum]|uniref:Uncharacterized protein n=1 Tax=Papaver somniferum TaxID=3469 RepID=A0A4Y7K1H4_PAPSO|nr:hypothetical protein C5167_010905 [Papaver somniferum]
MVQADGGEAVDLGEILMAAPLQCPPPPTKVGDINTSMMRKLLQGEADIRLDTNGTDGFSLLWY